MTHRVLIVNDDAFELSTLSSALRLHTVDVIGEAHTIAVAQNLFKSLQPDVVIIDMEKGKVKSYERFSN